MKTQSTFTISVFSENRIGLLNKLTALFSRRRLNIESITISETERKGISRHTITILSDRATVENLVKQIRKIIEVYVVYGYENKDLVISETALFKVSTQSLELGSNLHEVLHKIESKIMMLEEQYVIVEKTGSEADIMGAYAELTPFGIIEFVRSGRVALERNMKSITAYLPELEINVN
ncbi:MAG TPA: acetolactate synthase small subunit [Bacteroidia bacterium]|jgi:acetolactate synthase-1/3 small subunit|nr:acetolactate synthase small subunit [Bacteroidia bacterium]HRG52867.1 acetolactate synthase small subunit [Bacteroidia bacterium]